METLRRLVGTGMALVLVLVGGIGGLGADPTATEPQLIAATIFPYTSEQQDGFVDKVLKELARRAGGAQGIQAMPLGRALDEAKKRPSLLVPLGRNKDREEYLNYGPVIYDDSLLFVVRAGEKNSVPTLESAKGMAIGTHINSTTETFLRANGFQDINTAMDNSDLLKMLLAKHVDVTTWPTGFSWKPARRWPRGAGQVGQAPRCDEGRRNLRQAHRGLLDPRRFRAPR